MTRLFNPVCELVVYVGTQKYTIRDLHMDFDIQLHYRKDPNTSEISVYGLSDATRGLFSEASQAIEFYVGYEGSESRMVFQGETSNVRNVKLPDIWRTDIYAGDGYRVYTYSYFVKSYDKGTTIRQILTDITGVMGLPSRVDETWIEEKLAKAETFQGKAKDVLDYVTDRYDYRWSIQRGVVEITIEGTPFTNDSTAVSFGYDTGMIGVPSVVLDTNRKGKAKQSISVTSLINLDISPNRLFRVSTESKLYREPKDIFKNRSEELKADGVYLADRVRYYGNNYDGTFFVDVVGQLND